MPLKDLTGQVFSELTVIKRAPDRIGKTGRKNPTWECLCSCGKTSVHTRSHLTSGDAKSCGCVLKISGRKLKPGMIFERLTIISYKDGWWKCRCICDKEIEVETNTLTSGNTKSCGCLNGDIRRSMHPDEALAKHIWTVYKINDPDCVSFKEFMELSQQNCTYCNIEPNNNRIKSLKNIALIDGEIIREATFSYNGMDRIDNTDKSHRLNNVCPCCYLCNRAKSDKKVEDFIDWIMKLQTKSFSPLEITPLVLPENNNWLCTTIKVIYGGYNDENISIEDFYALSQMNCFYCNTAPSNYHNYAITDGSSSMIAKEKGWFKYSGLDRIDPN